MNLTAWVDVAIGLCIVYLGASLFVTIINEYVAQILNLRGKQLVKDLKTLICDSDIQKLLTQSPAIRPFFGTSARKAPSYVDPNVLARLLVGGLAARSSAGNAVQQVSDAIDKLPNSELKTQLQALARTAGTHAETLVAAVSDWADRSLTVLGERYKRNLQKISLGIGLALAVLLNVDTVALTEYLYRDKDAREAVAELGVQLAGETSRQTFDKCINLTPQKRNDDESCAALTGLVDAIQGRNESLGKLPIGWSSGMSGGKAAAASSQLSLWTIRILGWALTALALSLGAPFWFDLLNKLVNVRHGMRKPEATQETSQEIS